MTILGEARGIAVAHEQKRRPGGRELAQCGYEFERAAGVAGSRYQLIEVDVTDDARHRCSNDPALAGRGRGSAGWG